MQVQMTKSVSGGLLEFHTRLGEETTPGPCGCIVTRLGVCQVAVHSATDKRVKGVSWNGYRCHLFTDAELEGFVDLIGVRHD